MSEREEATEVAHGCGHHTEEVRSANGLTLYGLRCAWCRKQWSRDVCNACGRIGFNAARPDRASWRCLSCMAAARKPKTKKRAEGDR